MNAGLECVRTAAKLKKKERFTALLRHAGIDLLRQAYSWLSRDAVAGVDGIKWDEYAVDEDDFPGNPCERFLQSVHQKPNVVALVESWDHESELGRQRPSNRFLGRLG